MKALVFERYRRRDIGQHAIVEDEEVCRQRGYAQHRQRNQGPRRA